MSYSPPGLCLHVPALRCHDLVPLRVRAIGLSVTAPSPATIMTCLVPDFPAGPGAPQGQRSDLPHPYFTTYPGLRISKCNEGQRWTGGQLHCPQGAYRQTQKGKVNGRIHLNTWAPAGFRARRFMGTDLNEGRGFKPRRGTKAEAGIFGVRRAWRQG